jgi:putative transposase
MARHPSRDDRRRGRHSYAHWGAIAGADFFTTEVWTWRGLVTYYTVFVIDLTSRRVHTVGSTPYPNELFMGSSPSPADRRGHRPLDHTILSCDRDRKWSEDVRRCLGEAETLVLQMPVRARNANAHAVSASSDPSRRNVSTG